MEVSCELQAPAALALLNNPCTNWIRDWVDPTAGLDVSENREIMSSTGIPTAHRSDRSAFAVLTKSPRLPFRNKWTSHKADVSPLSIPSSFRLICKPDVGAVWTQRRRTLDTGTCHACVTVFTFVSLNLLHYALSLCVVVLATMWRPIVAGLHRNSSLFIRQLPLVISRLTYGLG